jgi:hypothetical protein
VKQLTRANARSEQQISKVKQQLAAARQEIARLKRRP